MYILSRDERRIVNTKNVLVLYIDKNSIKAAVCPDSDSDTLDVILGNYSDECRAEQVFAKIFYELDEHTHTFQMPD